MPINVTITRRKKRTGPWPTPDEQRRDHIRGFLAVLHLDEAQTVLKITRTAAPLDTIEGVTLWHIEEYLKSVQQQRDRASSLKYTHLTSQETTDLGTDLLR